MRKKVLLAASLALATTGAFAQLKAFEGFSIGLNAEMTRSTTEALSLSDSSNSTGTGLQLMYTLPLGNQFALGLGATASFGTLNAGSNATLGVDFTTKNRSSFDLTPSYALTDTTLLYGKVSALSATGVATTQATGVEDSKTLTGLGYGLGVRTLVDKNIYLQLGYDWNKYDDVTNSAGTATLKGTSNVFSLGVGYKF